MLANLKAHAVSGAEPWKSILDAAHKQNFASLTYQAKPRAVVECGSYDKPSFGCADERDDAAAAWIHALLCVQSRSLTLHSYVPSCARHLDALTLVCTLVGVFVRDTRL